ncbi:DUF6415 family natural product biosynthesis protein [Streptomyces sp. NPDC005820]|uniref:DUF6415 family natural product biosynthesis protein n=1 Tax=Streptomyces sp. NPDC005820 TaxID=3157069 RepID=UPI003401E886
MTNGTAPRVEHTGRAKMTISVYKVTREGVVTPPRTTVIVHQAPSMDITVMRETVEIALAPEALGLSAGEVATLTQTLCGHLGLLIPVVEQAARKLDEGCVPRHCALACVGEARGKLRAGPTPRFGGDIGHARRLARVLKALCDHYESFGGDRP